MKAELTRTKTTLHVDLPSYVPPGGFRVRCIHVPLDLSLEEWQVFTREVEAHLFAQKEERDA
jgi:hypothetical protein